MTTAKHLAMIGVYIALIIGGQLILSGIVGVEIVTALIVIFCYKFGIRDGVTLVTAFSLLRCFIFGFFPSVLILYLIYFNFLAVVIGLISIAFKRKLNRLSFVVLLFAVALLTACFTLLDDIISPLYYGYDKKATKAYFIASLPVILTQVPISTLAFGFLAFPIHKCFDLVKINPQ